MHALWSEVPTFLQNHTCIFSFSMIWFTNRNYFGVQTVKEKTLCMILFDKIVSNFMDLSGQKDFLVFGQYHTKPVIVCTYKYMHGFASWLPSFILWYVLSCMKYVKWWSEDNKYVLFAWKSQKHNNIRWFKTMTTKGVQKLVQIYKYWHPWK